MLKNTKWLAEKIISGVEQNLSIWEITIENASVVVPSGKNRELQVGRGSFTRFMTNYFSFGLDARVGFGMYALLNDIRIREETHALAALQQLRLPLPDAEENVRVQQVLQPSAKD